jgi:hypothetical protein
MYIVSAVLGRAKFTRGIVRLFKSSAGSTPFDSAVCGWLQARTPAHRLTG